MAGLRFAVLLAASSFGVLLLAAPASSSSWPPAVYDIGDEWRQAAPSSNAGTHHHHHHHHHQMLNKWAMRHRFYVGDVLDFSRSNDSVLLVRRRGDYEQCSAAWPARRFVDGGHTRFTLRHRGLFYFISGSPARCEAGQRMVVRVHDARSSLGGGAPTPAPAPAPGRGTMEHSNGDLDRPSDDPPIPFWFKLLVPAVIGFLAGCFPAGVIICLCMNSLRAR